MKTYFITGTDTGVGKTRVACYLLNEAQQQGQKTIAFKPIASGCQIDLETNKPVSEDALALLSAMTESLTYEEVNQIALLPAIAPHIALSHTHQEIFAADLISGYEHLRKYSADVCIIEGSGGWRMPLNEQETWVNFVKGVGCQVVLVVGLRLGCINHALLTAEAIQADGCEIAGWVGNQIDAQMECVEENIEALKTRIHAPYWGFIPFEKKS